jgi:beta-N-acetylhexosaminidase
VAATAKHFPGFGRADRNTDDAQVTLHASAGELDSVDLPPFRAAVAEDVGLVMASHALYPALDPGRIASQSARVLRSLLRERLGFRGVVVTDSIEADAVLRRSGVGAAAERSIEAGADLVLMTGSGSWSQAFPRLVGRARRDPSFGVRLSEAAGRVLELKRELGLRP